jgi:myo-inositol-1(or 4)-monophosphatase
VANYLAGLPWYSYGLALVDASGPVVGVISEPGRGEIYAAARGRGTRVNGVPVRIPDRVAAGLALALEAGAVVLDRHGRPDPIPTGGLLVAAPSTASVVLDRWRAAASPRRTEPG